MTIRTIIAGRVARPARLASRSHDASTNELATELAGATPGLLPVAGFPLVSLGQGSFRRAVWAKPRARSRHEGGVR